ncbi:MAG: DUF4031 domain-containing protein [Pyrinomonadaceae bacterium]
MAVYVDGLRDYGWRHGPSCHLIADSVEELVEFAESMGMRREWFQAKSTPHFDLTADGRHTAVSMGAIELSNRELGAKIRELRHRRRLQEAVSKNLQ